MDEETEAQKASVTCPRLKASKWQSWDLKYVYLNTDL